MNDKTRTFHSSSHRSYDPIYFTTISMVEERHFWFQTRNKIIFDQVKWITYGLSTKIGILEVGYGTGNILGILERACPKSTIIGMDLFIEGLKIASTKTHCSLVCGDLNMLPFRKQFNIIGLFDVLEHLPEDEKTLNHFHNYLTDDGFLVLTVPARKSLWCYFDVASHHCRRYEMEELKAKFIRAGYNIEFISPFMAITFPLVWLVRRLTSLTGLIKDNCEERSHDMFLCELSIIPIINSFLVWLLSLEACLITRRITLPFGTSLIVIARKKIGLEL